MNFVPFSINMRHGRLCACWSPDMSWRSMNRWRTVLFNNLKFVVISNLLVLNILCGINKKMISINLDKVQHLLYSMTSSIQRKNYFRSFNSKIGRVLKLSLHFDTLITFLTSEIMSSGSIAKILIHCNQTTLKMKEILSRDYRKRCLVESLGEQ